MSHRGDPDNKSEMILIANVIGFVIVAIILLIAISKGV